MSTTPAPSHTPLDPSVWPLFLSPLVQHVAAHWPRRGRTLLEIGCGDGAALELLWTFGFDVAGVDRTPERILAAQERFAQDRLNGRAEFHLAPYEALPFDDEEYNYVVLFTVFEEPSPVDLEMIVEEAFRIAEDGVLLVFPNRLSLAAIWARIFSRRNSGRRWYNPVSLLWNIQKKYSDGHWALRSLLPGPERTWGADSSPGKYINSRVLWGPFGAYTAIRIDKNPSIGVTGLPLRVKNASLRMANTAPMASQSLPSHHARNTAPFGEGKLFSEK